MKILKGIIGTILFAFTGIATSNIALANSHDNVKKYQAQEKKQHGKKVYYCKDRSHRLSRDGKRYYCFYKDRQQGHQNNHNMNGNRDYTPVVWKTHKGRKYAFCPQGYKAYTNGRETRCHKSSQKGWSGYRGLLWSNQIQNNGGSMRAHNNNGYKYNYYDQYRYMKQGHPACKKGKGNYRNYSFHCGGN